MTPDPTLRERPADEAADALALVQALPQAVICLDAECRVVSANDAAEVLLGTDREHLIGRRALGSRRQWTREDGSRLAEEDYPWRLALHTGAHVRDVTLGFTQTQDGERHWVAADALPLRLPNEGAKPLVLVTLTDATSRMHGVDQRLGHLLIGPMEALRQSQERLGFLLDRTPTINWTVDQDLCVTTCRGGAMDLLGMDAERVIGMGIREVLGGAEAEADAGVQMHRRALTGETLSYEQAIAHGILGVTLGPVRRDDGAIDGVMGVAYDLTEHHRLQQHLIQADKMATIGIMAAGIAHQLRSPMTIVSLNTGILLEDPPDPELRRSCLEKLRAATQRAAETVTSLLKLAYPNAGTRRAVDLGALVEEAQGLLEDHLDRCRVEFSARLPDPPLVITGDAGLLLQVFMNLIVNACDAMPDGGRLDVSLTTEAQGMVAVNFRDTGHGIAAEDIRHVFDPFYTTKPPASDTSAGVGLSICDHIVTRHGGRISARSEPGMGATFTVLLPLREKDQP